MGDLEMEKELMKRFRDLEASQEKLREQLGFVVREGIARERGGDEIIRRRENNNNNNNDFDAVIIPGYFAKNPYHSVLQHIGHAIYVSRPITDEIIYWNHSAENLYGWNEYEALGQKVPNLLIDDENLPVYEKLMDMLHRGQTWSGQFPFRQRSGQMVMAMITKSPLYENNELIGVIAVSSDSAILNDMNKEKTNAYWNEAHEQQRENKFNFGRLRPQPVIASSVSNLLSQCMKTEECRASDFSTRPKGVVEEDLKKSSVKSKQCSESSSFSEETRRKLYKVLKSYSINHEQSWTDDASHGVGNASEGLATREQILGKRIEDCPSIPADSAETNCSSKTGSSLDEMKEVNLATKCDIRWEDLLVGEEVGKGCCHKSTFGKRIQRGTYIRLQEGDCYYEKT